MRDYIGAEDFSFNFLDLDRNQINFLDDSRGLGVEREPREGSVVISRDINVRMIDKDARIYEVILNIRVWE